MTTTWFSLRRRLLGLLLGGVAAAWLVTMVFSYIDAHHEVDELFDAQLAQAAQTLLALASHDEGEGVEDLGEAATNTSAACASRSGGPTASLLMRSNNAPESPLTQAGGFRKPMARTATGAISASGTTSTACRSRSAKTTTSATT
jgi:two-component system sensor histidine kinase QseC